MGKIHLGSCFSEEVSCSFVIFMLCSVDLGRLWVFFKVSKKIIRKKIYKVLHATLHLKHF